jgi:hypothetical protein
MSRTKKPVKRKTLAADIETYQILRAYAKANNMTMIEALRDVCKSVLRD